MSDKKAGSITITDVTLREFGQNVPAAYMNIFTPEIRARIASDLIDAGFQSLEVFSCIHPKVAPAMNEYALRKISRDLGRVWQTKGKQQDLPSPHSFRRRGGEHTQL